MTKAEFKARAGEHLRKVAGASDVHVFVDHEIGPGEKVFGASCTFRGKRYEMTMVHGDHDDVTMGMVFATIERFPGDVDKPRGGQPRRRARAAGGR